MKTLTNMNPGSRSPSIWASSAGPKLSTGFPPIVIEVVFHPAFRIGKKPDGSPNFLGPFAQGRPMDRFFYLSWGVKQSDQFRMFRRLKIRLTHLKWPQIDRALDADEPIVVKLRLTDERGGPLCGTPDDSRIAWES